MSLPDARFPLVEGRNITKRWRDALASEIAAAGGTSTIVGITGTKSQFDTACTDGNFAYQSDLASYLTTASAASTYQPLDTQLTDLAGLSYTSNALKVIRVNAGETGFELVAIGTVAGDVTGPGSATDNALARMDGTTGKIIQNSSITVNDSGAMTFPAGDASNAPINLTAGTVRSSAAAGTVEFDGKVFYSTPAASARGVSPSTMFAIVPSGGFALSTSSGVQSCFPATSDVWTLEASTTYFFEGMYSIQKSTNAVTTAMAFALGGGASVTSIRYFVQAHNVAVNSASTGVTTGIIDQVSSTVVTASSASFTQIRFSGIIRMNAGGTVTPQISFSGTAAGTPTMLAGSYIMFTPLGTNTVESVGNVG